MLVNGVEYYANKMEALLDDAADPPLKLDVVREQAAELGVFVKELWFRWM